jgi:hypothetical protein
MVEAVGQEYEVTLCTQVMCSVPSHLRVFAGRWLSTNSLKDYVWKFCLEYLERFKVLLWELYFITTLRDEVHFLGCNNHSDAAVSFKYLVYLFQCASKMLSYSVT